MSAFMLREYTTSFSISWLYMDVLPLKNSAKKLVKVINPKQPTCIRIRSTNCPRGVNVLNTSTGVSPVMHTALVLTNKASA